MGGDNFPKKSTTLIFNCNNVDIPKKFAEGNIYSAKGLVTKSVVSEMDRIST